MTTGTRATGGVEFVIADAATDFSDEGEFIQAPQPRPRGLALKELTLHQTHEGLLVRWWDRVRHRKDVDGIFYLSTAIDGSGNPPFVWPINQQTADLAYVALAAGETHTWTLGDGAPIFPARELKGSLAVSIIVSDSDDAIRHVGEVVKKVTDDLSVDGDLTTFLAGLVANPGAVTAQAALEAIGKTTAVVADVLQQNQDDFVGTYVGLFPALSSWDDKLHQDENGASILLVETGE
jgi:hypothetical protein